MKKLLLILSLLFLPGPALAEELGVLISEKARETYGATMPDAGGFSLTLPPGSPSEAVIISAFWMDTNTGQFAADAVILDGSVKRVVGLAILTVPVPVPTRRLMPDDIIAATDIEITELAFGRVGSYAITEPRDLIGQQVKRMLTKGRPIMRQSIMPVRIISRGDKIKIQYSDGALALSAPGLALSDAYQGQTIKVVNLISNKNLMAQASAKGIVEVRK